jgi:vWA-MoxR associated protein C-terminal domain/vWA-MoxR associated protein middle region (VMAP-M) 1/Trypsin-like peptidase domain
MTFNRDGYDYSKAIVCILKGDHEVGTGFLIAPGYVLTCAHVVLQAIDKDFRTYEGCPQENIVLDFPVLDFGRKIEAKVFDWLPYGLHNGDVAVLKLLTQEPTGAKPMPLDEFECDKLKDDPHSIYGFGRSRAGCRSDAYRPKVLVAGGRFQLLKFGDPDDETIEPGFSGAPVWSEVKKCVIGMVATAQNESTRGYPAAYAIPTKVLRPVLGKVKLVCLHDVLIQSLESCSDDDRRQLQMLINSALRHCNPNGGDRPWQDQLIDLSTDRAPALGWENEGRLVQFAMMLVRMAGIRENTYYALKNWVKNVCHYDFNELLERIVCEMTQQRIPRSNICQHLMVVVEQIETSIDELRIAMWAVEDRNIYNPWLVTVEEESVTMAKLPAFIRYQIQKKFRKIPCPTIHLFLPRALFGSDIEMQPCGNRLGSVLGSEYSFIVRTNLKTHPIGWRYYDDWSAKWEYLETTFNDLACHVFKTVDCSLSDKEIIEEIEQTSIAVLQNWDSVNDLFGLIAEETALPVALWSRNPQFQDELPDMLDCVVRSLHDRIREKRETAHRSPSESLLGHHLSLVWEDPIIVPPDMQFDPEAS